VAGEAHTRGVWASLHGAIEGIYRFTANVANMRELSQDEKTAR
jgi:hypothetical protein